MILAARYNEMQEKMQVIKDLYRSRHYTKCAESSERLLSETHDEIHPLHLAYLNFYSALSHDTLAREATLKNRYRELSLAEKHYIAAISALSSVDMQKAQDEQPSSPISTMFKEDWSWKRRSSNTDSFDSTTSAASSTTSYSPEVQDVDANLAPTRLFSSQDTQSSRESRPAMTLNPQSPKRHDAIDTRLPPRPQTPLEYQFAADTSAFVRMVQSHLASVQQLKKKTAIPGIRFTFPSPQPSPTTTKPKSSQMFDDEDADVVRQRRKSIKFRPRFDPTSVRQLCCQALAELS